MRCVTVSCVVLLLYTASRADDAKSIQGKWSVENLEHDTEKLDDLAKVLKFAIDKDHLILAGSEVILKDYAKIRYKIDSTVTPTIIDLTVTEGDQKDTTMEGIYELKGDTLKLCIKVVGKERPSKFETSENSNTALIVLKREKP